MLPALLLFSLASSILSEHIPSVVKDASRRDSSSPTSSSFSSTFSEYFSSLFSFFGTAFNTLADTNSGAGGATTHGWAKRDVRKGSVEFTIFACLIPVLVILSGIFAGLTLGYMSLDETQLNVLSISGTAKQREYANKIKPIRKDGHLLLVTLLLANMITNETLPVISDPILGGGVQSVIVSTTLIVLFAEIIPQSICTRHGLYIGAKCAGVVRVLIWIFGIISWPVAKLLEFSLGPHHGIIYRRAELKELIALHGAENPLGGDLRTDTVTIIGATLDLQDKTVRHAMTSIDRVFMLHIDAKLDYDTLRRICATGHSRIPVYEEVELTVPAHVAITAAEMGFGDGSLAASQAKKSIDGESLVKTKVKKIIGILLVKQCVLLDPEDAVPVRKMRLIKVPFVPQNEPLLHILDRFQEGRSHMAIVSRLSVERAQSVKKEVRKGLTQRLLGALHGDSSASDASSDSGTDDEDDNDNDNDKSNGNRNNDVKLSKASTNVSDGRETLVAGDNDNDKEAAGGDSLKDSVKVKFAKSSGFRRRDKKRKQARRGSTQSANGGQSDLEQGDPEAEAKRAKLEQRKAEEKAEREKEKAERKEMRKGGALEQRMPADAVLSKKNAEEYLASQGIDPAIMPLGIITLEDVLEELIGEEIYDEFDVEGTGAHSQSFVPPGAHPHQQLTGKPGTLVRKASAPELATNDPAHGRMEPPPAITPPSGGPGAGTGTGTGTAGRGSLGLAMPRPIALTSLKNLGFLRSRSAPPTPRDPVKQLPPSEGTTPPGVVTPAPGHNSSTGSGSGESEAAYPPIVTTPPEGEAQGQGQGQGRQLPQIVESPSTSEGGSPPTNTASTEKQLSEGHGQSQTQSQSQSQTPTQTQSHSHGQGQTKTSSPIPNPALASVAAPVLGVTPKSRSASPAPSLEAAILHTKRRVSRSGATDGASGASSGWFGTGAGMMPSTGSGMSTGTGSGGASASGATSSTPTEPRIEMSRGRVKGAAFKSSPLSPVSADASAVVAEEIKKEKVKAREKEAKEREEREAAAKDSQARAEDQSDGS